MDHPYADADADSPLLRIFGHLSRYVALLAAWLALGGSLFFSEVLGWVPCTLCWYQRILMYPLSLVIAIGILRRDDGLPHYVLPFALPGAGVSLYHYLLIKTDWFPPPPCQAGVPCTVDYLDLFGFINIPFLALTAFLLIALMMLVSRLAPFRAGVPAGLRALIAPSALAVYAVIIVVVVAFVVVRRLL
ncbi:disulfide bond formation protein DsbB [Oscillochloris trichoides DG-6]|uniref:Disulfide bond formation protein DsbB n=1 Tax=Oscillochloris trichoides DG-6 TaxID=765420 RepID=E1II64_9CHLR|nr:disulfide bond formation protein DsbB [Oscillochloris trichoides DG-6]